ncbi:hypothetical protein [Streptococcus sp. DD13]|uniref:hypothetical protein n=1 Tax=Streptococcus sp. DD13 TaxID=1777881 RepID=UPI000796C086|nr:hypothetical protein [Streptococcus sp. DD13]KXT78149.1 hypothetical protein STRDD13_00974 [Streptococcus sp. DD13]
MITVNAQVRDVFQEINFINRYEAISQEYDIKRLGARSRLNYLDGELVMDMIAKSGYTPQFDSKEKFFKFYEQVDDITFGLHFILFNGTVEFIWAVTRGKEILAGSPWGIYPRLLIDPSCRIRKPIFSDYDELEEILDKGFAIYEDFKQAFLKIAAKS